MITAIPTLPASLWPRERAWQAPIEQLSLHDLLMLILGTGAHGHTVSQVASTVSQVLSAENWSMAQLAALPGVGKAKAATIAAAMALAHTVERERQSSNLASPERIYQACADLLDLQQEHLVVFYLSVRHHLLKRTTICIGTANASLVHAREVFRPAILTNANHIILAHNHPSGDSSPSLADEQVTHAIAVAGVQIGIGLVDHVICSRNGYTSLKMASPHLFC